MSELLADDLAASFPDVLADLDYRVECEFADLLAGMPDELLPLADALHRLRHVRVALAALDEELEQRVAKLMPGPHETIGDYRLSRYWTRERELWDDRAVLAALGGDTTAVNVGECAAAIRWRKGALEARGVNLDEVCHRHGAGRYDVQVDRRAS